MAGSLMIWVGNVSLSGLVIGLITNLNVSILIIEQILH